MNVPFPRITDISIYACPTCKASLRASPASLDCDTCEDEFPLINAFVPILVSNPLVYVAGERAALEHNAAVHQGTGEYYQQTSESAGIRRETLKELGQGLIHNGRLLKELSEMLPAAEASVEEHPPVWGSDLFAVLRKDWSGEKETEAEVAVASEAILRTLDDSPPNKTLVLGAGAGRTLCDIDAKYPGAVGIDLSSAMGSAFERLCSQGQLSAYHLLQGNFLRAADECDAILARRELAAGNPQYAIADAAELPFLDASFDAVVSNYFTDLAPLSKWLPEVKRVLKPSGRLVHFGPLGYAFAEIAEHYAVDQLPAALRQHGFEMKEPEIIQNSFYGSSRRLNRFDLDNLLFSARRIEI